MPVPTGRRDREGRQPSEAVVGEIMGELDSICDSAFSSIETWVARNDPSGTPVEAADVPRVLRGCGRDTSAAVAHGEAIAEATEAPSVLRRCDKNRDATAEGEEMMKKLRQHLRLDIQALFDHRLSKLEEYMGELLTQQTAKLIRSRDQDEAAEQQTAELVAKELRAEKDFGETNGHSSPAEASVSFGVDSPSHLFGVGSPLPADEPSNAKVSPAAAILEGTQSEIQGGYTGYAGSPKHSSSVWGDFEGLQGSHSKKWHLLKMRSLRTYAGSTLAQHVRSSAGTDAQESHPLSEVRKWWSQLETSKGTGLLAAVVDSKVFQSICVSIILVHACLSTLAVNAQIRNALSGTNDPETFSQFEIVFLIWYSFEVFVRIVVHGLHFFIGEEWGWNLFDFLLVIQGLLDEAVAMLDGNMLILRPLRLFKVVRVLRAVRAVRFLEELRLMVICIVQSVQTLVWCIVLLVFIQYFFSMFLVQGMVEYVKTGSDDFIADERPSIEKYFSSVQGSVLTLWMAVTGGEDWGPLYLIIRNSGAWSAYVFIFYTAFFVIAALNIVTGTFVNKAFNIAKPDPDMVARIKNLQEAEFTKRLTALFRYADKDSSGGLKKDELVQIFENERHALLEILGVSNVDTDALYDLLEWGEDDETDEVNIESFVTGLMMLSGPGRNIDIHLAEHRIMNMLDMVQRNIQRTCQQFVSTRARHSV